MDFIVQLPITQKGHDAIVVFVDRYTKRAHFHPTHTTVTAPEVAKIFFDVIFKHHGLPKAIISDWDAHFTSHFWKALFEQLGTKLSMSTAFHPQTDRQTERMNCTLEEMLRIHATSKINGMNTYQLLSLLTTTPSRLRQASLHLNWIPVATQLHQPLQSFQQRFQQQMNMWSIGTS